MDKKQEHPNIKARNMPSSSDAEQAILGCVLLDADAPIHILPELKADDFYYPAHKDIYEAMLSLSSRDVPVDFVTLVQELETFGSLERAGGVNYVATLSNVVPSASNYKHYMDIVKKDSLLRKLIKASDAISANAYSGDPDNNALNAAERSIYELAEQQDKSWLVHLGEPVKDALDRMEQLYRDPNASRGIPTGFKRLDMLLNGFQGGDLVLIAARPGQGKTSIGMNFIQHAALCNTRKTAAGKPDPYKCAVFSLEMPMVQLAKRMLCATANINMSHANSGNLTQDEWQKAFRAKGLLDKAKIYIDDSSMVTPIEMLSKCRRLKREQGLDMIMVDYLQLMSSGKRVESRQLEISEITRTMKIAAKELNVPILLLSQMSRDIEKRTDKTPVMADLRESGAIEQDADIIMFLNRLHDSKEDLPEAELNHVHLIIAKHRNGETGRIDLQWRGEYVRFDERLNDPKVDDKNIPPQKSTGNFDEMNNVSDEIMKNILTSKEDDEDIGL